MKSQVVWFAVPVVLLVQALNSGLQLASAQIMKGPKIKDAIETTEADYFITYNSAEGSNQAMKYRPGSATETNSCQHVREVPQHLRSATYMKPNGLSMFYQKYTEAYGIPVLSSPAVPDDALRRVCYTLRFMLAGNSAVRKGFYRKSGRVAVIGKDENTNDIPEHSHLDDWINQRGIRGIGATTQRPTCSSGEENALCYPKDRYWPEDIAVHETAHGIDLLGGEYVFPYWGARLKGVYIMANTSGLWANTYSMTNAQEYFAEGAQSFFDVNTYSEKPNGIHGPISTREKLRDYDPALYNLLKEAFPCDNTYLKRCESNRSQEDAQVLRMNCDLAGVGGDKRVGGGNKDCINLSPDCEFWANEGHCTKTPGWMEANCKKSCSLCDRCTDIGPQCVFWESIGECTRDPDYMRFECKKSCKVCEEDRDGGGDRTCGDEHKHCYYWASIGECAVNPGYMLVNCMRSCQLC